MELRQLRYFVGVAEQRHFTRAAAQLHVAQPALSQQIRRLEDELGLELLARTSRSVALTQAGELLLVRARRVLAEVDGIGADLDALKGLVSGRVVVGAIQALGPFDLPGLLAAFHGAHPGVDILLREDTTQRLLARVAADELDLAVAAIDPPPAAELATAPLYDEDLVLAVAPGHRLAGRRRLALADLPDEPFVFFREGSGLRAATEGALAAAGIAPRVRFESSELTRVRALVSRGLGVAILPRSETVRAGPRIAAVTLGPPALERHIGLVWRRARRHPPAAAAFLAFARARGAVG
jgi:LysR family transcriptional regulator, transcription activator of glutamate synthase operon